VNRYDPWTFFVYDDRWRMVAAYKQLGTSSLTLASTATLKERFIHHAAGLDGLGGSSYIDSLVLRDRDIDDLSFWWQDGDGGLEERIYYCQNWRADVSVILPSTGCSGASGPGILEWIKYGAYGVPQAFSMKDYNRDGAANGTDSTNFSSDYGGSNMRADVNFDGSVTSADQTLYNAATSQAAVRGTMSCASVGNRVGYAGYQYDPVVNLWHVRHRVLNSELGRWTRRDPAGYVGEPSLYEYVGSGCIVETDASGLAPAMAWRALEPGNTPDDPLPWTRRYWSDSGCRCQTGFTPVPWCMDCFLESDCIRRLDTTISSTRIAFGSSGVSGGLPSIFDEELGLDVSITGTIALTDTTATVNVRALATAMYRSRTHLPGTAPRPWSTWSPAKGYGIVGVITGSSKVSFSCNGFSIVASPSVNTQSPGISTAPSGNTVGFSSAAVAGPLVTLITTPVPYVSSGGILIPGTRCLEVSVQTNVNAIWTTPSVLGPIVATGTTTLGRVYRYCCAACEAGA
jgi:RHS repeat-associated protein